VAILAATGLRGSTRRYLIAEQSMTPALNDGDWVIAQRSTSPPNRGDIVVFDHPVRPGFSLVKRVIGLPSETLGIRDGRIFVDGRLLAEPWSREPTRPDGEWRMGPGEVFVLSDARGITIADSRAFGPIREIGAQWRVRYRYRPLRAVGRIA
jgi:signal peptidase I